MATKGSKGGKARKSVEEQYKQLSQYEQALVQPDVYVGGTQPTLETRWLYDGERCFQKEIEVVDGLYKIVDEVLTNASDHHYNGACGNLRAPCTEVRVTMDAGEISVWNNGDGIPVEVHAVAGVYVPEMIFGTMGTSSHYDEAERKTGGKNGLGAKLANIYSDHFEVETVCEGRRYLQRFEDQIRVRHPPEVTACKKREFTRVTFRPRFRMFGVDGFSEDFVQLVRKRCLDLSACYNSALAVYFNGERIPVVNLLQYMELCYPGAKLLKHRAGEWTVVATLQEQGRTETGHAFANTVNTYQGGTHFDYVYRQVAEFVKKKAGDVENVGAMLRGRVVLAVACRVVNATFEGQSKLKLKNSATQFRGQCELPDKFLAELLRLLRADLDRWKKLGLMKDLSKADRANRAASAASIEKYTRATWAGTAKKRHTVLVLSEGDSANSLINEMRSVIPNGKERIGTYPLRGKLMNVKHCKLKQVVDNECLNDISVILGFKYSAPVDEASQLRYGKILILTDQDYDGSHIKGLVINYFHEFFRVLLDAEFVTTFRTPIVRFSKRGEAPVYFYTLNEAERWREARGGARNWQVKYFKGLGTINPKEDGRRVFSTFFDHIVHYVDDEQTDEAIHLAFHDKAIAERKVWLSNYRRDRFIPETEMRISICRFVHDELIHFSNYDNIRSIPNMYDGLKPCQRKILHACLKYRVEETDSVHGGMKVAQLAGMVAEKTGYHHGEQSLQQAIVNMAQNFCGANNVNLLYPDGQFGTRAQNGKDAASARYIYTHLTPIARKIFRPEDAPVLEYLEEDNRPVEPLHFMPIVPMLLVNGAEGIGTGYSTAVPSFNPATIIYNLKAMLRGEPLKSMHPHVVGFRGRLTRAGPRKYSFRGAWRFDGADLLIQEMTPHQSLLDHKKKMLKYLAAHPDAFEYEDSVQDAEGLNIRLKATKKEPRFLLDRHAELGEDFEDLLALHSSVALTNMHAMDPESKIVRFEEPQEVMEAFFQERLRFYGLRKAHELQGLRRELLVLRNRARFVAEVNDGQFRSVRGGTRDEILAEMAVRAFDQVDDSFDYLLEMKIYALTREKVNVLNAKIKETEALLAEKEALSERDLWLRELDELEEAYAAFLADRTRAAADPPPAKPKARAKPRKA